MNEHIADQRHLALANRVKGLELYLKAQQPMVSVMIDRIEVLEQQVKDLTEALEATHRIFQATIDRCPETGVRGTRCTHGAGHFDDCEFE